MGSVARRAERYSDGLCKAILRGVSRELHHLGYMTEGEHGVQHPSVRELVAHLQHSDGYVLVGENDVDDGRSLDDILLPPSK